MTTSVVCVSVFVELDRYKILCFTVGIVIIKVSL